MNRRLLCAAVTLVALITLTGCSDHLGGGGWRVRQGSRPEEWAKVDGPHSRTTATSRKQSLRTAAAKLGVTVATSIRSDKTGRHWVYARVMR